MLEVEGTGQHGCTTTRSDCNGNEAATASEVLARWLHHQCAPPNELPSMGGTLIVLLHNTILQVD